MAKNKHNDEEVNEEEVNEAVDDLFVADTGRTRKGMTIDIDKFNELCDRAITAISKLKSNSVVISLPKLNATLGTSFTNVNSLAWGMKKSSSIVEALKAKSLAIGSSNGWKLDKNLKGYRPPVEEQGIRFAKAPASE